VIRTVAMPKYTLTYFPTAGTACSIRLLFKLAGVEFTNVGIPWIEWTEAKQDEKKISSWSNARLRY